MTVGRALRAAVAVALAGGAAVAVAAVQPGRIGPQNRIQPDGRKLHPAGRLTELGNHPYGGALTPDGRFLWTLSAGRGVNDVRIVAVTGRRRGKVIQRVLMPGLSGGIAFDPKRNVAYVSGLRASPFADEHPPASVPGQGGDVIHVLRYSRSTGKARRRGLIAVPPPPSAPPYQDFPPNLTARESWPQELAISPNGKTLLAALNLADAAAVVDTRTRSVRDVSVGHYPYGAAIDRAGHGFVTSETQGVVSEIDLGSATKVRDIQVGAHLSHAEGMAIDPRAPRAYVAITADDQIGVIDTNSGTVERTLSVARPRGNGTEPVRVSVTPNGCYLVSADAGEDALAVFALPGVRRKACQTGGSRPHPWQLIGRIPTAAYPIAAQVSRTGLLAWVAAKGLGVGPNPNGPNPNSPNDSNNFVRSHFQYLPSIVRGEAGILPFPSLRRLHRLTPKADRELVPTDARKPPRGTPLRANGPIKHVFYIVKENRTYDQVLGDMKRGDGDPHLTLFGRRVTPNLHALAARFGLFDHVYADSEASIDGHYWTSAGTASDYVVHNWHQNYPKRGRPYDFGSYEVSAPPRGYIFERLLDAHIPFFNYGEALAGLSPLLDKDKTLAEGALAARVLANSDVALVAGLPAPVPGACYDSDLSNTRVLSTKTQIQVYDSSLPAGAPLGSHSRFDCFRARFDLQLLTGSVPEFNYLVLPNDHTEGTKPGQRTPTADIASNDWALGQIVDLISHSSIWKSSLILVQEDDSQDGADHVDAHRMPALAISPYTRKGAIVNTRYDQLSILRTAELVMGLRPQYLGEALAVPMYNAFMSKPANSAPYSAIRPNVDMNALNTRSTPAAAVSARLPLNSPDMVSQRTLDRILWKYVHGQHATPPPAGPNASTADADPGERLPLPRIRGRQSRQIAVLHRRYRRGLPHRR